MSDALPTSTSLVATRSVIPNPAPVRGDGGEGSAFHGRKILCEILPSGIVPLNKPDLLFAPPPLDFLFAGDRVANIRELFAMDQPENPVSGGESWDESLPVFNHPALEVIGYTDVQVSRPAGQDVNPIRAAHLEI